MNKLLFVFILISHCCFGQSESKQNFTIAIHIPDNNRNSVAALQKFVTEHNIQQIRCYEDKKLVAMLRFDTKGNALEEMDTYANSVSRINSEYDALNRCTRVAFHHANGDFNYGYKYTYDGPYKTEFKIGDSIPKKRTIELKDENITIYSNYTDTKEREINSIIFQNDDASYSRELRYTDGKVYLEFKYFYNPKKQEGGTKVIHYDYNGTKISEEDRSAYKTDKNGNRIERYSAYATDTLQLISTHKFNEKNQVLEHKYPSQLQNFEYNENGQIVKKTIDDRNGITVLNFYYKDSLPEKIVKRNGDKKLTFSYEYEYFK
ncbi:MAG: hypothetical protein AAF617_10555 [Bacteroidota bacterium]